MRAALAAAVVLALVAPAVAALGTTALWPDHASHSNMADHVGVASGMVQVAQLKIRDGTVGELDVVGDLAIAAHWTGGAGIGTVDISDPANPRLLGTLSGVGGTGTDAKLLPGGLQAVLSTQGGCNGLPLPSPRPTTCGVNLIDVSVPAQPRLLSSLSTSDGGVHMLEVAAIGPANFVFAVDQESGNHKVLILAVAGAALLPVGVLQTDNPTQYVHDITVRPDALTGRVFAYVAGWGQGVHVFDVTVPAAPVFLGKWDTATSEQIHTVMPAYVEGKRLIVAAPEYKNTVHILDATDLANIVKVGQWRFPDHKPEGGSTWSTHDFNIRDNKVYLAHYHGGVVVFGVRTLAEAANPPLLAYILPTGTKYGGSTAPNTWDAVPIGDGYVLAGDISLGFVVLRET